MDFSVKKLASDAGVFFSRAVQFTQENLGQAEKTELDAHFENLLTRADNTKNWTEKILHQTEVLLQPSPSNSVPPQALPDFQETRPRNYILSASASALWSDEVDKAEHELRVAQTEFDRQAEVTRLLLEGISSTHVNHLRCLHEFAEAQATYFAQSYQYMLDLQKQLGRFPVGNTDPASQPLSSSPPPATLPVLQVASSNPGEVPLNPVEVTPPVSGTRKARVLYDYEAADITELALFADELITVYSLPGMDPDWLVGERGNKKGKVPVTYLELLS
ncbi:hypothetical protein XELAEV_18002804mg [Xenopus laevis]|nr:hypothetical protein XELAEV_18002804mg [Xenopus laevis]